MIKVKSLKATTILMVTRDNFLQRAADLLNQAEIEFAESKRQADALLATAKTKRHASLIQSNKLKRDAALIQEAIAEELELEANNINAYEVKSNTEMLNQLED